VAGRYNRGVCTEDQATAQWGRAGYLRLITNKQGASQGLTVLNLLAAKAHPTKMLNCSWHQSGLPLTENTHARTHARTHAHTHLSCQRHA
jgi:hypothetical protein